MLNKVKSFLSKYEPALPLILFILFFSASLPGITWGAPALWHPDELVWRVSSALRGEIIFDVSEPDWNYPSLPKYVMYAIGLVTYFLGKSDFAFIVSARIVSVVLGAISGILIYLITKQIGGNKLNSFLAGILYLVSGEVVANARFAHNDLYLQFFTVLCLYFVILFLTSQKAMWLYVAFIAVGMAASSKYTGASMVFLPVSSLLLLNLKHIKQKLFDILKTLFLGGLLVIIGYGMGTPRLFFAPVDYLSNAIPAAIRFSQYGFNSGESIGLYGQWNVFREAVGTFEYFLFLLSFIWFLRYLFLYKSIDTSNKKLIGVFVLVLNIIIFDLPFLVSINYVPRHFIPFIPLFSILAALLIDDVFRVLIERRLFFARGIIFFVFFGGILYSSLRLVSISLLFLNDSRILASTYIDGIQGYGKSIEYTLYPPVIEKKRFLRAHNYPIYFVKYADDTVPTGGRYEYNLGEQGLLERGTDYFVIDNYTYDRFYTDSVCLTNIVECNFFKKLLNGEVKRFKLIKEFSYTLPPYLPQVSISAVNPEIKIYELEK